MCGTGASTLQPSKLMTIVLHPNMNHRRLIEIVGSFLLGGGCVAFAYELVESIDFGVGSGAGTSLVGGETTPAAQEAEGGGAESTSQAHVQDGPVEDEVRPAYARSNEEGTYSAYPPIFDPPPQLPQGGTSDYPLHGLVVTSGIFVRERADKESRRLGMMRQGARMRVAADKVFGGGCSGGWRKLSTGGFMCGGAGITVASTPPEDGLITSRAPDVDSPLPFEYWRVSHDATPFFYRLPSFAEQERADNAGAQWLESHGRAPMPTRVADRPGEVPAVVKEYLNASYYVTVAGEHVKSQRRFLRTNRGIYARKYQLQQAEGSSFRGQVVSKASPLPKYFVRRSLGFERRESEGSDILLAAGVTPERRSVASFDRRVRIGNYDYFETADGMLLRVYAVSEVRKVERPSGVGAAERWVHVDLSEQTLTAYQGDEAMLATLVSTGREPGMTPVGVFRVQSKFITTSMRDQPPEEDAYSIEDVPWTQYFDKNIALHGAFWHSGFGIVRSHGCVNLSPSDARWLFGFLASAVPEDWHAVMPGAGDAAQGSVVYVTE